MSSTPCSWKRWAKELVMLSISLKWSIVGKRLKKRNQGARIMEIASGFKTTVWWSYVQRIIEMKCEGMDTAVFSFAKIRSAMRRGCSVERAEIGLGNLGGLRVIDAASFSWTVIFVDEARCLPSDTSVEVESSGNVYVMKWESVHKCTGFIPMVFTAKFSSRTERPKAQTKGTSASICIEVFSNFNCLSFWGKSIPNSILMLW